MSNLSPCKWKKIGLVFVPDQQYRWSRTHASLPTPVRIKGNLYRVFFSSRDENNCSHISYFDINLDKSKYIIDSARKPILSPGPLGYFDDHGIYASSAVKYGDYIYLYTIGWNPGPRGPLFYSSIGLAISEDGGLTFRKYGRSPIMSRSDYDPCLVTAPTVLHENDKWRMWYVSGYSWEQSEQGLHSRYHIKYAESDDGITWNRDGLVAIDHENPDERNISRVCILPRENGYSAWYGFNAGNGYRIGYAESADGLRWKRWDEHAGIGLSSSGWDSKAMSYPAVVEWQGQLYMFYNGNEFGRDGIGLAVSNIT